MGVANDCASTEASCCPFCQQDNQCISAQNAVIEATNRKYASGFGDNESLLKPQKTTTCWCFVKAVPRALIELLPATSQGKYCICQNCVDAFNRDPEAFKRMYYGK